MQSEAYPFYISIENEDKDVLQVVEHVFRKFEEIGGVRIPRKYVGSYWHDGEFGSVKWYVQQAYNPERKQALVTSFWDLFEKEPWQKNPHYELMILETDLYAPNTNFVFGMTRPKILNDGGIISDYYSSGKLNVKGILLSLNRIRRWYDEAHSLLSFNYILVHELGHFYGLPSTNNPNFIRYGSKMAKSRLDYGHCNRRDCIMEQVNVPGRLNLLEKALYLKRIGKLFCENDERALRENLRKMYNRL